MEKKPYVRYSKLSTQQEDEQQEEQQHQEDGQQEGSCSHMNFKPHEDLRYRFELPDEVPWKSIALAIFLLTFGTLFLVISHFIYTEHMEGEPSQAYGFLVLGVLLFLPGFYETRIAYYSWRGFKGYRFSRIPAY